MATHSSVLAWRIPGTEEPGELPSGVAESQKHYWSNLAAAANQGINKGIIRSYYIYYKFVSKESNMAWWNFISELNARSMS